MSDLELEESSEDRRRPGHISKQGNTRMRFLLVQVAQVTVQPFECDAWQLRQRGDFSTVSHRVAFRPLAGAPAATTALVLLGGS